MKGVEKRDLSRDRKKVACDFFEIARAEMKPHVEKILARKAAQKAKLKKGGKGKKKKKEQAPPFMNKPEAVKDNFLTRAVLYGAGFT